MTASKPRTLFPQKPKTVIFISDGIVSSMSTELIAGIAQYAQERRNFIIRALRPEMFGEDVSAIANCDGIILNTTQTKIFAMAKATGRPIVDTACEFDDPDVVGVDLDTARTGVMAADWFMRRGFKNFAFCGTREMHSSDIVEEAFTTTLAKAGFRCIPFKGDVFPKAGGNTNVNKLQKRIKAWVATLPPRTAVLCKHDFRANQLLQICVEAGRSVPDDIAIMGRLNDATLCMSVPVTITSIDTNIRGQGYAAMRIMAEILKHPVAPKRRPIFRVKPGDIIERESTAVYPIEPKYLADILPMLDANPDRAFSTAELAAAANVSQTTLQTAFRKNFGMSAGKYMLSVRMREAKRLLAAGALNMKEIAMRTGFANQSYFCQSYRAFYGHPPSIDRTSRK